MVTLENDAVAFRFPDVHPNAELRLLFQRTLHIPDDGEDYPLPENASAVPQVTLGLQARKGGEVRVGEF
jgi:hypothetical protein